MGYSTEDLAYLFQLPAAIGPELETTDKHGLHQTMPDLTEQQIRDLEHRQVGAYCVRSYRAGQMLELAIYPVIKDYSQIKRAKRKTPTKAAQAIVNARNARDKFIRTAHANFGKGDIFMTLTYKGGCLPPDEKTAKKDMQNFIRRVRSYIERHNKKHPDTPYPKLRYMYVTSHGEDENGKIVRIHHHLIMSRMDRDALETIWRNGHCNTRRIQPTENGMMGLAVYIDKNPREKKRYQCSRGLKHPQPRRAYTKISRRKIETMAASMLENAPRILGRAYPGYHINDAYIKANPFISGAYMYARLFRDEKGET